MIINKTKEMLAKRNMSTNDFKAKILMSGLSESVYSRLLRGETSFTTDTLDKVVLALGLECIDEIIGVAPDKSED